MFSVLCFSMSVSADDAPCDISGKWKHADKSAWLYVDLQSKNISVAKHDENPKAKGLTVIKQLTDKGDVWSGAMFDARSNAFLPVELAEHGCHRLVVTMNKETILTLTRE